MDRTVEITGIEQLQVPGPSGGPSVLTEAAVAAGCDRSMSVR
jgi:hypothetical protein